MTHVLFMDNWILNNLGIVNLEVLLLSQEMCDKTDVCKTFASVAFSLFHKKGFLSLPVMKLRYVNIELLNLGMFSQNIL